MINREHRKALQALIKECETRLDALRQESTPSRRDVVSLAERLGRRLQKGRGTEPMYKNENFSGLRTLAIPNKSPLKKGTSHKILNHLEEDVVAIKRKLDDLGGPINDD